jgi:hypothetical protein
LASQPDIWRPQLIVCFSYGSLRFRELGEAAKNKVPLQRQSQNARSDWSSKTLTGRPAFLRDASTGSFDSCLGTRSRSAELSNETAGEHFTPREVIRLTKARLLYQVAEKFTNVDLHPRKVTNAQMGLVSRS